MAIEGIPPTVATFVRQDPIVDPETGEVTSYNPTVVEAQYCWLLERTEVPMTRHWMTQAVNPWDYVETDEEVLATLDTTSERHIMKIGLTGHGFQKGDYRYGNHDSTNQVDVPNYLFERWSDAGVVIGPPV